VVLQISRAFFGSHGVFSILSGWLVGCHFIPPWLGWFVRFKAKLAHGVICFLNSKLDMLEGFFKPTPTAEKVLQKKILNKKNIFTSEA